MVTKKELLKLPWIFFVEESETNPSLDKPRVSTQLGPDYLETWVIFLEHLSDAYITPKRSPK